MANALNLSVYFSHDNSVGPIDEVNDDVIINKFFLDPDDSTDEVIFNEVKSFLKKARAGQMFSTRDNDCIVVNTIFKSKTEDNEN